MKSILTKLLIYIITPLASIYAIQILINISIGQKFIFNTFNDKMITTAKNYALQINNKLELLSESANKTASNLESLNNLTEKELYDLLIANVMSDSMIYGSAIAFVPNTFTGRKLFSPYAYRKGDSIKTIDIGKESYNYSDGSWDWYSLPIKFNKGIWTEPYYDKGAGNIKMCTYSVPFYKNNKIWGVATIDIAIEPLEKLITNEESKYKSFAFVIISKTGNFIYHPNKEHILKDNILNMKESGVLPEQQNEIGKKMIAGKTGTMEIYDAKEKVNKLAFYAPVKSSGWSVSASLNENEAYATLHSIENNLVISFIASLSLIIILLYIVSKKITKPILKLKEATQNFADGKPGDYSLIESNDEIGALNKSFTSMAAQLTEREATQKSLLNDVNNRVKELQSLYKASQLTENIQNSIEWVIEKIADEIPKGMQSSATTSVKIVFQNIEKTSTNYKSGKLILQSGIFVDGKNSGKIEVTIPEEDAKAGKFSYPEEEQKLIETISIMISGFWQRKTNADKLIQANEKLEAKVKARTKDLEGLLSEVNSLNHTLASQNLALNASAIVSLADKDGILLQVNEEFCKVSKYSRDELVGQNYRILNSGYHSQEFWKNLWETISKGEIWRDEILNKTKDGSFFWVDTVIAPITDNKGIPKQYLTIRFDVTDKKMAETNLNETKEKLDMAISSANMGLWEYFISENRLVYKSMKGKSDDNGMTDFDGSFNKWLGYLHPKDSERVLSNVKKAIKTGEKYYEEFRIYNKNNELRYFTTRGIFYKNEKGEVFRGTGLSWDITHEKKVAEELTKAKAEAEAATVAKSQFLATMSHEIRTPMNAIIGFSNLAMQTGLDTKQKDYIEKIDRSAHSLMDIINDILDFSKIEEGKLTVENIVFDLEYVIDGVSNLISPKAQKKGIEFIIHIAPDVPLNLVGDPLRVGQILTNYCSNAVKFTNLGEIVISADLIRKYEDKVEIKFTVSDTGIGLTEDQIKNLFKSFSQADSSTTRKYGGTGLGLAICKNLSEIMNGEVGVSSEFGKGSSFYFTCSFGLPENQKIKEYVPSIDLRGMKVLVCDDNKTTRKILREALETFSFEVTTVSSGNEALETLKTNEKDPFELVLMDWKMPGMDGIETTHKIKNILKEKPPTVIMVTAFGRDVIEQKAKEEGINAFLIKPVSYSTLFDTIMEVFGKEIRTKKDNPLSSEKYLNDLSLRRDCNILLVEDNEINRQIVCELLANAGLNVETAENGKIALDMILNAGNSSKYDLIFIDLQMPVMDGFTATKEIRKIESFKNLPIIAITADVMPGTKEKCIASGMNDMITKPIHPDRIFALIKQYVNPTIIEKQRNFVLETTETLPESGHINTKAGISRVGNNRELYSKLLIGFSENNSTVVEKIREAKLHKDEELLSRLVHTVKGVAANLGIEKLHLTSSELEKEIHKKNDKKITILINDFESEIKSVFKEIIVITKKTKIDTEKSVITENFTDIKKRLNKLKILLDSNDYNSTYEIENLLLVNRESIYHDDLESIAALIDKFDLESAKILLENLLKKIT